MQGRRTGRWLLFVAPVLALVAVLAPATAPGARAATDSLTLTTSATYTLVPSKHVVRVAVDVNARNDKPDLVSGGVRTRYFYDGFRLGIQPEARTVRATAGRSLAVSSQPADGYTQIDVRFPTSLFHGETTKVHVTFDLPGGAPRSKSEVRVGPAFATFDAWAFGDSGSVRIVVPGAFSAQTTGSDVTRSTSGGATVFSASGITDVADWYAVVNADRASALTSDRIDLTGGEHLVVHAWPDDPVWAKDVTALLSKGLPELVAQTGLDWPVTNDLGVFEVHTPLLEGYAGIFYEDRNRIEISEDLDDLTILHEASHAWFNSALFNGRWINEGFADTYASRALNAIGLGDFRPDAVSPTDTGSVKLNAWTFPGRITNAETDARERFGYNAAWTVVRSIVTDVGEDRMHAVLAAADAGDIAYVGAGPAEHESGPVDWRRLLDLLDEQGRPTTADDLFRQWVVSDADLKTLDARAAARAEYAGLLSAGGDWLPPLYVRQPMADWSFPEATGRIDAAVAVLAKRTELTAVAGSIGVSPPLDLRTAYQAATTSFDDANALADREIADGKALETATTAVDAPRAPFVTVGLMGETPEATLAGLRDAFSRGDDPSASIGARAAALTALIDGAAEVGRGRVVTATVVTLAVVLVLIVLLALAWRRRGRRRTIVPAAASAAAVSLEIEAGWVPAPEDAVVGEPNVAAPSAGQGASEIPPGASATLADQSAGPPRDPDAPASDTGDAP